MRIITIINLSSLLFISFLSSCTKNDNPTPINGKKIKTIKTISGSDTINQNYYYNSDGTINYNELISPNSYMKNTYTYNSNKFTVNTINQSNILLAVSESLLRVDGLVDSAVNYYVPSDSIATYKYIYNSSNEPIQVKYYKAPFGGSVGILESVQNNTFSNGNLVKQTNTLSQYFYTYEYYNTVSNLTPEAYGLPYNLLQSTNLVKTIKLVNSLNPSDIYIHSTHIYSFDSENRVVTHTEQFNGGNIIREYTYY